MLPNSVDKGFKKVFKDTTHRCRDLIIPISGWDLFWYFYEKSDEKILVLNSSTLDLDKLIVLNVFIDVEFIKVLAQYYHPATGTIRMLDGSPLVALTKEEIIVFYVKQASYH